MAYLLGKTPSFICQAHPCFSYCLYVPKSRSPQSVLVAVHDTLRNNHILRDLFAEYAEATGSLVLAPLFPAGIGDPNQVDDYKYLRRGDLHYDQVLFAMLEEVGTRYQVASHRFGIFGFSGGAHFAHRLLYLAPQRLAVMIAAAPGSVTLPDASYSWWPGLAGFEARFGHPVDWSAMRQVPVHLLVGAQDTSPGGTVSEPSHPLWVEGANAAGSNRVERLRSLRDGLSGVQVDVSYEELPDVGHELAPCVAAAVRFLAGRATLPA